MALQIKDKIFPLSLGVIIFSSLLVLFAQAWQEPTQAPPGGNVDAPLNIGSTNQTKSGELGAALFRDYNSSDWYLNPSGVSFIGGGPTGGVGIGVTSLTPGVKLEVAGDIKLSGSSPRITNVSGPIDNNDVANKEYVLAQVAAAGSGGGVLITFGHYCGASAPTAGLNAPACPSPWTEAYTGFSNVYMNGCSASVGWAPSGGQQAGPWVFNSGFGINSGAPGNCNITSGINYGAITCRVCVK